MGSNNSYPLISIVTPNFNGAAFLEETIQSILGQNYPNLEYIIIDGGSTDDSVKIIKKYEKHLSFWISEPDKGLYHALQKGFNKSTGELMAWLNSDDMLHPNALDTVVEIFKNIPEVHWLQGKPTIFDEKGRCVHVVPSKMWTKFDYYLAECSGFIQQESTFWKRSLWENAGAKINVNLKYAGDYELWLRFFSQAPLYITDALVGGYRTRSEDQLSLDYALDYVKEVHGLMQNWELTLEDRKTLKKYRLLNRIITLFPFLKIINFSWFISRFRSKYFGYTSIIYFDRIKQSFRLK